MIEPSEVPAASRAAFKQEAVRKGLDPNQALSIEQLQRADSASRNQGQNRGDRRRGDDRSKENTPATVAGFGADTQIAKVQGFGPEPTTKEGERERRRGRDGDDGERRRDRDDGDRNRERGRDGGEERPRWGGGPPGGGWGGAPGGMGGGPGAGWGGGPPGGMGGGPPGGGWGGPRAGGEMQGGWGGGPPRGGFGGGPPGGGFGGPGGGDRGGDRRRDERRDERRGRDNDDGDDKQSDDKKEDGDKKDSDDSKKQEDEASKRAKVGRYAESLLKQYDKNKDGVLDKDEWSSMRGEPQKSDTDGDGKITVDELTTRLAGYSQEKSDSSSSSSSGGGDRKSDYGSRGPTQGASGGRGMRFLTATERLPPGLPSWFTQSDRDGDGQVKMSEYASNWNDEKLMEFSKYDTNSDGLITPAECLGSDRGSSRKW